METMFPDGGLGALVMGSQKTKGGSEKFEARRGTASLKTLTTISSNLTVALLDGARTALWGNWHTDHLA